MYSQVSTLKILNGTQHSSKTWVHDVLSKQERVQVSMRTINLRNPKFKLCQLKFLEMAIFIDSQDHQTPRADLICPHMYYETLVLIKQKILQEKMKPTRALTRLV